MVDGESFRERAAVIAGGRITVDPDEFERIRSAVAAGEDWYVAALVHRADAVAFVRNRWSDGWVLPGGGIEEGETMAEAAEREIREETGLAVDSLAPLAAVEHRFEPVGASAGENGSATAQMAVFEAAATAATFGDDLGETPEEIEAAAWFEGIPERVDGTSRDLLAALLAEADLSWRH